ncbi:MAG: ABC transporter ATP-binding protein [Candidatus Heimdallarchaeota archaeon]|nr:ABC transporter ATP-binding protein [Candidatus Heimdallarchaeota archaeon]MCK5049047.1 ABC transporter ATP-binding protein [Candidatus Heimdallarchaeota archaeon]
MSDELGTFMVATLVDWKYPQVFDKTWKKINKIYKKNLGSKRTRKNRINTFVITEAELMFLPPIEKRISVENQVKALLKEYADTIDSLHEKEVKSQGNINKIYEKDLEKLGKIQLYHQYLDNKHDTMSNIESAIEEAGEKGGVIIWDLPGHQEDRVILPECVATFSRAADQEETLIEFVDELLIANFARRFLPYSHTLILEVREQYEKLLEFVNSVKDGTKISADFELSLRTFIGVVSGIQETLKLFYREIEKSFQVGTAAFKYIQGLNSEELTEWAQIKNPDLGTQIMQHITDLQGIIAEIKTKMRGFLSGENPMNNEQLSQFTELVIDTDVKSNGLLLWTHRFHQIPSFTSMEEGIAYEEVEGESYRPKSNTTIIEATKIFKTFSRGNSMIYALRGIDLQIEPGEFIVIRGPSGAGKTTLLQILAGLEEPGRGAVFFESQNTVEMKDRQKTKIRRENYSFIFQSYALIPHLTAFENAKLPINLSGLSKELSNDIQRLLEDVGIGQFADHKPALLSGGQMQRLGIARSLVNRPKVLFADEPTGDLDERTGMQVMDLLKKYHEEMNVTIILVTHDEKIAKYATREIFISDGRIIDKSIFP